MRKVVFLLFIALTINCKAQSSKVDSLFKYDSNGLTDYIVDYIPNKTTSDLYKKTLEWISKSYKNPKEVILAQIENEYIRIEGADNCLFKFKILGMSNCIISKYQIEIYFKDGKCKFDPIKLSTYSPGNQYNAGYWMDFSFYDKTLFKENGEFKKTVNMPLINGVVDLFNKLNRSYYQFMISDEIPNQKDNW